MPKADFRERRRAERLARKKKITLIASIAAVILLVAAVILIIQYLPSRVNAEEVDTVFPIKDNAVKTSSGLIYQDLIVGEGPAAKAGDTVGIIYSGYLPDGQTFDSNVETGEYYEFVLGTGAVIPGWDEGVQLMKKGSKARFIVPANLAYGDRDLGKIPPNSTLIFDVEVLDVK